MIELIILLLAAALLWNLLLALVRAVRGRAAGPRRFVRGAALALVALVAIGWAARSVSDARRFQLFGELVPRVETPARLVALTFDDGPMPARTDTVLAALAAAGVRATFFLTGASIEEHPEAAARIARAGHEVGNHTWSHRHMLGRSVAFTRSEVERTDSAIRAVGYDGPIQFRPPYGKRLIVLPWVLARTGRTTILWDVEPDSDADVAASADGIVRHVRERVEPGSIVLLHVMFASRATSLEAVPSIIEALHTDGYRFVTVSELLRNRDPDAAVARSR